VRRFEAARFTVQRQKPLDFIAKLAALVPKPRVNLTRFHGVLAPNSKHRVQVTPAKRGKGSKPKAPDEAQDQTPAERRAAMTWAQRLKRVFTSDVETCRPCGGGVNVAALAHPCARGIRASMHIIACMEDPVVIEKILTHRNEKALPIEAPLLPRSRASPQAGLFD
jgi:hypothetical protein